MKEVNLYITNPELDHKLIEEKLSKFFCVNVVQSKVDNSLVIDQFPFVDWEYISKFGLSGNHSFVFLEEYEENSYKRDRYIPSGISYVLSKSCKIENFAIACYENEVASFKPILFLDRDGIINVDTGYVYKYSDEIIFKDMIDIVKTANKLSIPVVIVTNQAGVARGKYSLADVDKFHEQLIGYYSKHNARIDHIEVCPFHKDKGSQEWKYDSLLRKPNPGMHLKALAKMNATASRALMVGDKESDRVLLHGVETLLLSGNYEMDLKSDVCSTRQELCHKISNYLNNLLDFS